MPETKALAPVDEIVQTIGKSIGQYAMVLPPQITPEKFVRVAQTAIRANPTLASCTKQSLYAAFHKCAADGLIPDGREAAITYFTNKTGEKIATYMPMVQGICKKVRNSGELGMLDAVVVYEKDEYDSYTDETGPHFRHRKARGDRGEPILTFAYATTKDGSHYFEEIDEAQMKAIESASKAKDGPWKGPFRDEMKRKSAIRRLAKYRLPSSADLDSVIRADDELNEPESSGEPEKKEEPKKTSTRLSNVIDAQVKETPAEEPQAPEPNEQDEDLPI